MVTKDKFSSEHLLTLIGQQVIYQNQQCEIIELLDGCQLVLQVLKSDKNIQATQYGEGHRTVPITHILTVFDGEGFLHSDLAAAGLEHLLLDICKQLSHGN
ncbi:MAG: hypothetical protein IBX57_01845 [Gammaproteobacteria bacterium]|nr:hypothetical protein [Gammaproteobacteria bacterium]